MKGIGIYSGLSSLSPMCNNSNKRLDGKIYRVFSQESEVNFFDLLACEIDQVSLLCRDLNLCADLMSFDREDYFTEDRAI